MDIHVVRPGDTLYELAYQYGVPMSRLIQDNQLPDPSQLVVGQTLVIQYPRSTYTVRSGDTLFSIARNAGVPLRQLLRNNPGLEGGDRIYPGQELVLTYQQEKQGVLSVNGYAYPNIAPALLQRTLPFLSSLAPFTYRPTVRGDLIPLSDNAMVAAAQVMGVRPLLHLANLTEADSFSGELAHALLSSPEARTRLADHLMELLHRNGYRGIDVDLESIFPEDAQNYVRFLFLLRERLEPLGYPLLAALAPKTSACQQGELYQGHDYRGLGEAADGVLLMTYEWGYAFGPPMAVAPLDQVRRVAEYALTEVPAEKIWLGIPNYGYDWLLPAPQGSQARSLSNPEAVALAARHYAAIRFDPRAQAPWFRYVDGQGQEHEVWFEDARSIRSKLALAAELELYGVGYWNLMRPFPQNWAVLNSLYEIRTGD